MCCGLENVSISASNLISLNYGGKERVLQYGSIPLLSEFSLSGFCVDSYVKQFASGFGLSTQLTTLKLHLSSQVVGMSSNYPQELTAFAVLKYLEIKMDLDDYQCPLWPICLVKAAPFLHKFKAEMTGWDGGHTKSFPEPHPDPRFRTHFCGGQCIRNIMTSRHKFLKVVEFHGFTHSSNQWELVEQIVEFSESLENMVLDLDLSVKSEWCDDLEEEIMEDATSLLLVAPGIKLEVRNSRDRAKQPSFVNYMLR